MNKNQGSGHVDYQRERIEMEDPFDFRYRFLPSSHCAQTSRIEMGHTRVVGIELKCSAEFLLGLNTIPVIVCNGPGQRAMCLGQLRVYLQRPSVCCLGSAGPRRGGT